jgi:hypothetical protein
VAVAGGFFGKRGKELSEPEQPTLTRWIDVASIPPTGMDKSIVADEAERRQIAGALGLVDLASLSAELTLSRGAGGLVDVSGRVAADLVQSCVVSLEPVAAHIDEPVEARFVPAGTAEAPPEPKPGREIRIGGEAADLAETYSGPRIDIGRTVLEHFVLAIDPYPRAPGAELPADLIDAGDDTTSPFAVLSSLGGRKT